MIRMSLHDTLKKNKNKKNIQIGIIAVIGISLLVIFSVTLAYFSAVADQNINNDNNAATAIINE